MKSTGHFLPWTLDPLRSANSSLHTSHSSGDKILITTYREFAWWLSKRSRLKWRLGTFWNLKRCDAGVRLLPHDNMVSKTNSFSLNPCPNIDGNGLLVSLKLNSQLQSLLENDANDSSLEIEFTSLTSGKIYCGSAVFDLKFSDSTVLVSYFMLSKQCRA